MGTYPGDLYTTTTGGAQWTRVVDDSLSGMAINDVEVDRSGTVYVAAGYGACLGVVVGRDAGRTWTCSPLPHGSASTRALAVSSQGAVLAAVRERIYRSTDRGTTWLPSATGLSEGREVWSLAVGPDGTAYAGTLYTSFGGAQVFGEVIRSADAGLTWDNAGSGLPGGAIVALTVDGAGRVYAGVSSAGVFRSDDRGGSWRAVNTGLPDVATVPVAALLASPSRWVFAGTSKGLFASDNGGRTWLAMAGTIANRSVAALAGDADRVFAGTDAGVFLSSNATSWQSSNAGLRAAVISGIVAEGTATAYAFGARLHKTTDGGATWRVVHDGFAGDVLKDVGLGPAGVVYAAWRDAGLLESADGGATWTPLASPAGRYITALDVDATGTIHAGASVAVRLGGTTWASDAAIFRSTDGGVNWASPEIRWPWGAFETTTVLVGPGESVMAVGATPYSPHVVRSGNGGLTWQAVLDWSLASYGPTAATPIARSPAGLMYAWARAPTSPETTLHRSEDGGANWKVVGPAYETAVASVAAGDRAVYIAPLMAARVLATYADTAPRWTDLAFPGGAGAPVVLYVTALAMAPVAPGRLYVATSGRGVYTYLRQDNDADGLPDDWEVEVGLDPASAIGPDGGGGDPDRDGIANLDEYAQGTHPRGSVVRYFAEGSGGGYGSGTRFSLLNPGTSPAHTILSYRMNDGTQVPYGMTVPSGGAASVLASNALGASGYERRSFSTVVESDAAVVVDRTEWWGETGAIDGSSLETAVVSPAMTWYLAEGATHSGFELDYVLFNPNDSAASVQVTYLRPAPSGPLTKQYTVGPYGRTTVKVDDETLDSLGRALSGSDVAAVIEVQQGPPIVAERSMYWPGNYPYWSGGHNSVGAPSAGTTWALAAGDVTTDSGPYETYLLVANPSSVPARIRISAIAEGTSTPVSREWIVAPTSRFNIYVNDEFPALLGKRFGAVVESLPIVDGTAPAPIVVERAVYGRSYNNWELGACALAVRLQ
jgi:hypothetical protein